MNDGKFVNDQIVNDLIKNYIFDPQKKNKLIFDGYPRSLSQAKNLDLLLEDSNQRISHKDVLQNEIMFILVCFLLYNILKASA